MFRRVQFIQFIQWFVFVVAVGCLLSGCARSPLISVAVDPASGHPDPVTGELRIRVRCTGGTPPYSISFGDGSEIASDSGSAQHTYTPPYERSKYRVTATCESGTGFTDVEIQNSPPVFYGIFSVRGEAATERELVLLQVKHFTKGCASCPCDRHVIYGGLDPDGDVLLYEWNIRKKGSSQEDSVYDIWANRVNGNAVQGGYFVWFPGWHDWNPPYPFSPLTTIGLSRGSTGTTPLSLDSELAARPKGNYYDYVIRLTVRDACGASDTSEATWVILELDN